MDDTRPIGIFDSGVGGLSVLLEVSKVLPHESIVYYADQANVPYGNKSEEQLKATVEDAVKFFIKKNVKLIILACNTATVYTLDYLRSKYNIPIIGTVPVVKTLVENTKTGRIAILSTPATAKSEYLSDLINKFADGKTVTVLGQTGLESFVEKGDIENAEIKKILKKFLAPLLEDDVDAIALSCTHYPFLRKQVEDVVGQKVGVFDSGGAIARQTERILKDNKSLSKSFSHNEFYTTGDPEKFRQVASIYIGKLAHVGKAEI